MRSIKVFFVFATAVILTTLFATAASAEEQYSFEGRDLYSFSAEDEYGEILSELPDDLREKVENEGVSAYSFEYFGNMIWEAVKEAVGPALKTLSVLLGIVILSCTFNMFAKTVGGGGVESVFSICCILCMSLALWEVQKGIFDIVQSLLDTMNTTMLAIVPLMETVYITSGNITTAAVSATGVNLMISLGEGIYANVLSPGAVVCFFLGVCSAVTGSSGVSFMSKTVKGVICGILIVTMTLMSFVLALQTTAAAASDTFAQRTIRFAIGSYLPIVGGTVSESFSVISSSLNVIKEMSGVGGVAVLLIAFIPPLLLLIFNRFSIGAAAAAAGMLGADRERELLSECGSVCTLMIAVCAAGAVMYIVAIGIFCRTPSAMM